MKKININIIRVIRWLFAGRVSTLLSLTAIVTVCLWGNPHAADHLISAMTDLFVIFVLITIAIYATGMLYAWVASESRGEVVQIISLRLWNILTFPFRENIRMILFFFALGGVLHFLEPKLFPALGQGFSIVLAATLPTLLVLAVMILGINIMLGAVFKKPSK